MIREWWEVLGWGSFPDPQPDNVLWPESQVFIRLIDLHGRTLDLLGRCRQIEVRNVSQKRTSLVDARSEKWLVESEETMTAQFLPNLDISSFRIFDGPGDDRHLVGYELPSKMDLVLGVGHRT